MPSIKVQYSVDVQAGAERLWDILTDVQSWPEWQGTSYIKSVEAGPLKEGSAFVAELGGIKWNIRVIKANKPLSICWTGKRLGIVAIHEWEFHEEAGKTKAITRESMSGGIIILTYPIIKMRLSKYDYKWLMNLKSKAESR
jgi:uncharacterized membrane protein